MEPDDAVQGRHVSTFVRFQSPYPGKRGVHTGVFGLINTDDPRRIIYEDAVQIVVVPHAPDAVASFHA